MNNKYTYIEDREEDHDMVLATYRDTGQDIDIDIGQDIYKRRTTNTISLIMVADEGIQYSRFNM